MWEVHVWSGAIRIFGERGILAAEYLGASLRWPGHWRRVLSEVLEFWSFGVLEVRGFWSSWQTDRDQVEQEERRDEGRGEER